MPSRHRFPLFVCLLLLLCSALPASAAHVLEIDPPGPTAETPVAVVLSFDCSGLISHTVTRAATLITIEAVVSRPCPSVTGPARIPLGTLPAGEYTLVVHEVGAGTRTTKFVVRNAVPGELEVHPFAVPTFNIGLDVRLTVNPPRIICAPNCNGVSVIVDGVTVPASRIRPAADGAIFFTPPQRGTGLADVTLVTPGRTYTQANALYYYDEEADPPRSVFERILFPVLFSSGGAHGSRWVSEAAIANPKPWLVENYARIDSLPCIDYGCSEQLSPASMLTFDGAGYPRGIAHFVPRPEAPDLSFSLRVRDTSKQHEGYGTEVPVVREKDMFVATPVTLLDVPLALRYRTKLRLYQFDVEQDAVDARVIVRDLSGVRLAEHHVTLTRSCSGRSCPGSPWYGDLDLSPGLAGARANVFVVFAFARGPAWAFASVTNNETQQVTIVAPSGRGGVPCNPCEVP